LVKLVVKDPREFRDLIQAALGVVSSGTFKVSKQGLFLKELDPSRVALVDLGFPPEAFQSIDSETEDRFEVNLESLMDILKRMRPDDQLELQMDEGKLTVSFSLKKSYRSFKIPLMSASNQETPNINIQFTCKYNVLADALYSAIKDAATVAEEVMFTSSTDGSLLISASSDRGSVEQRLTVESDAILGQPEVKEVATAKYSLQYLESITSFRDSPSALLQFAQDKPLSLEYHLPDGAYFRFILAPRL